MNKRLGFTKTATGDYNSAQYPEFRIIPQNSRNPKGGKARVVQYYLESGGKYNQKFFDTLKDCYTFLHRAV